MEEETGISVVIENYVALVTIDRPPVNAMTRPMVRAVRAAFDSFNNNPNVRAAVLTGSGRLFCAGTDVKARSAALETGSFLEPGAAAQHARDGRECFNSILECDVPVIGAMNGGAIGSGIGMMASCDFIIASTAAYVSLNEINVGLLGGGRHAQRLLGTYAARRLMYTGDRLSAQDLYRRGVIETLVEPDQLMPTAMEAATQLAEKSPTALKLAKRAMNAIEYMTLRDGYRFEQTMTNELSHSEDAKEAALAFKEKRKPVFRSVR